MTLDVVFLGSSQSAFSARHFNALLAAPCNLLAVVDVPPANRDSTNPLPEGLPRFSDVARQRGLPIFEATNTKDPDFLDQLRALQPDLFIAAGYALILKPETLAIPRLMAVNFHASLLPYYRGKHPVFRTLRGGERWAGLTVHVMDPGIDTGDIIYQVRVRTRRNDTVGTLYQRIMDRSVKLVGRLVVDVERGTISRQPQPAGEWAYFSSTTEADFRVNWEPPAEQIRRAIVMTPGFCFTETAGRRVFLGHADIAQPDRSGRSGQVLSLGRTRCTVAAGDGAIWINRACLAGGMEQPMAALCRQLGIKPGDMLG